MWAKFAMEKQGRMKGYGMDYSMKIVKEIYKSQVYCVKNKTFINFALEKKRKHGYSKTDKGKIVIDPCWGCIDNKRLWSGDAVSAGTRQSSQPSCAPRRAAKDSKGEILYSEEDHFWKS